MVREGGPPTTYCATGPPNSRGWSAFADHDNRSGRSQQADRLSAKHGERAMKFTLSWLKDHLDTSAGVDEITETLTRIGLEVESIEDKAKELAPFTVAYVVSAEKHP